MDMRFVLLAEPDPDSRDAYTYFLVHSGFGVFQANNVHEALALADRYRPDVVLLDLDLELGHPWVAMRELKANPRTSEIPVIAIHYATDHSLVRHTAASLQAEGFCMGLEKPIQLRSLASHIESCITEIRGGARWVPADPT